MLERTISTRSTTGVVASYMSGRSSSGDCDLAVDLLGAVVFRGQRQRDQARRAKERGAMVWLDPAEYERPHTRRDQLSLFGSGDPWADDQKVVGVVELLSPGVEVPAHDLQALDSAITSQSKWLDVEGGGRLSLALHWRWLTEGLADLLAALAFVDKPIAVAFGDTNHPLEHRGAVPGLAELSSRVADLMLVRCDMGAFGALAHGARVATIGTGTSVRHFVPSGSRAYGGGSSLPSAFVESLLDFRQAELLARLPSRLKPTCSSPCCDGAQLDRFHYMDDELGAAAVRVHNLHAFASVAGRILGTDASDRVGTWREMATEAAVAARRIHIEAGPFAVRRQIEAWASL